MEEKEDIFRENYKAKLAFRKCISGPSRTVPVSEFYSCEDSVDS